MNCALSKEDELSFLALVYKELEVKAAAGETVDIKKYIQDFYNEALVKSKDKAKALTYTQILPGFMLTAYSNKRAKLKATKLDLTKLDEIIDLFENIDEVGKYVTPIVSNTVIVNASNLAKEKDKQPKKKKATIKEIIANIINFIFKPQTPLSTTGQQGIKTKDLTDSQIGSIIRKSLNDKPSLKRINDYRNDPKTPLWSNIKNKEEDFYYNFFHVFADALNTSNSNPTKMTINGHTGFKLKLINKSKIDVTKAKKSEQDFAARVGVDAYNSGTGAVVTDNDGNILYFDENYNVVSKEIGLPIYHNLRKIEDPVNGKFKPGWPGQYDKKKSEKTEYDGSMIQTAQEVAKNRFEPTDEFETLDQVKAADPALYKKYIDKAKADLQIQLKAMYDIRAYLMSNPANEILTDIISVSRGIVNVKQEGRAKWIDIDWAGSDVQSTSDNTIVATRNEAALNEVEGTAYLRIPGNNSIELQKDNISKEDVDKLASLLVDDIKEIRNKREVAVPFDTKMKLFRSFSIEYTKTRFGQTTQNPIQFIVATEKILFNGEDITELDNAKELIKQTLTKLSQEGSYYNTKFGQYAFKGTDVQNDFIDFSIENGILLEEPVTLAEHIRAHSTLKVIPNESNQIVYLNGYFAFDMPDMSLPQFKPKSTQQTSEVEGTNSRGTTYKGETTEKDGLITTKYSEFKTDGTRIAKGGRIMTPSDFIKEYNITNQEYLDSLEGATEIRIYEVRVGKGGKSDVSIQGTFPEGNVEMEVAGAESTQQTSDNTVYITQQTINEISKDFEEIKADQDPVEFVNRTKAVYKGVSLDTQYTINDDGSITLHAQKNFNGKQSGISFTPYLDTAFDYARRAKDGTSRKIRVSGTIIKINTSKNIMDTMSVESHDELSYIGGDVTLPKGSYEIIEGSLPGAERAIQAVQDFMLSENSILLNSVQTSSDKIILEKALEMQIAADSASEYTEYEGNTGENFVDNIENNAIVDAFGSSEPINTATNMLAKAIIYKYYKAFGKNFSKLKKFVGKESVYMNLAYGSGDYGYSDLIDFAKTGLENGDYEASFNKAILIDTDGNFKLQESVKQPTQETSEVAVISEDYGVTQVETNPSVQKIKKDVALILPQVKAQTYKENKGKFANMMFHYGKMWARRNLIAQPIKIASFDKGEYYAYHNLDQNGNPLPSIKVLQPIIDQIEQAIGLDMSDYDSVIGNIYLPGEYVYPHKDTTESESARNYPVIVYTIGNDAGLGIVDNNEGKMTFANQYDTQWLPKNEKMKGYTNEIKTKSGSIYTFGMGGKGRFELTHSTPMKSKKNKEQPPITLPDGRVVTNYTITLTFRRAADLTPGMPTTPANVSTQSTSEVKNLQQLKEGAETEKELSIADKIAALEAAPNEDTSASSKKDLHRSRLLPMRSTPKQRAKAEKWFYDESNLANTIAYKEMFDVVNSNGWAEFKNGAIIMYAGSDSTAIYHEAWHAFSQHFLSKEQKESLYKEVANTSAGKKAIDDFSKQLNKTVNNLTKLEKYLALEELIAEDFREYAMSDGKKVLNGKPQRNTIFRKILNFLKKVLGKITGITYVDSNTYQLTELFNKLYIGEINEYTPNAKNAFWSNSLYKSYDKSVSKQVSKKVIDSMDSIMYDYMELKNAQLGNTKWSNGVYSGDADIVTDLYNHTKNTLKDRALEMYKESEKLVGTDRTNKIINAEILYQAWVKFGDEIDGLMRFHMDNSPAISNEVKNIDQESFDKVKTDDISERFDKAANSISIIDYSSNQILSLVRGLKKYENGKVVYNEFGFAERTKWQTVWKTLISTLSNANESPRVMKAALEEIAPLTPWVNDLLNKLGPTNSDFNSVQALWTGFWSAFFMSHEKLFDILVNENFIQNEDGKVTGSTFEVLAGYASAVFRKAEIDFRSHFRIGNHPNPFIIHINKVGNVLDLKAIIKKFKNSTLSSNKEKYDFITSIGIPLSENNDIINGLSDVNVGFIYDKLVILNKHNYQITDIIQTLKSSDVFEDKSGTDIVKNELSNVNIILNLEAKFSGNYSNLSVMTAEGKIAYEQTRMSTLSRQVKMINDAKSFQELIEIPSMSYLDPMYNDSVKASNIINSLFDKNGKKRKGVQITIDNLDGTQNMTNNSFSDTNYSTSTSKADKFTRLQQDIYSFLVSGKASMFTPGDKGTITSFNVNKLKTERSEDDHLYVDTGDFDKKGAEMNLGMEKTYQILMPYLDGELKRIEKIKNDPNMPAIDGFTVPILNEDGTIEKKASGLSLGIFDDIFHDTEDDNVKSDILKYKSVEEIPGELQGKMMHQFNTYMSWQVQQTSDILDRVLFLDDNIKKLAEKGTGRILNSKELKKVIINSYTANKFINNAESLILFFGSITQFKNFDKRNSGINSTGRMFRTDQDFYDFVKNSVRREFAFKHNGETTPSRYTPFNGILQTAIFKDNIVDSKAYAEYLAFATEELGEAKAKKLLAPYLNMEEGDAQGWIAFDTYRILARASDRWSPEQEELYLQILNNPETVDPLKVFEYFPTRKYQYFGALAIQGIHATAFHKYSLMPLIPSVIKGKNIQKVHNMMMEQGIDYAVYRTGSKVSNLVKPGTSGGDVIYKKGEDRVVDESLQFTKNPIYLEYLKDQLDINSRFKNNTIFSSQLRKLIEEGLVENGVPVDFNLNITDKDERKVAWEKAEANGETTPFYNKYKAYENKITKLVKLRMAQLTYETSGKDGKTDMTKLVKFITKELERQELTDHEKEFIGVDSGGELIHDLSFSPSASKIMKTLNSIVNRTLIRQKINGEALVQISSSLFEDATNATEEQLDLYRQDELKSYLPGESIDLNKKYKGNTKASLKIKLDSKLKTQLDDAAYYSPSNRLALQQEINYLEDKIAGKKPSITKIKGDTSSMEVKVALQGNFKSLIHLQYDENSKVAVYTQRGNIKMLNQEETLKRLNKLINSKEFLANEDNVKMITMVGVRIPVQGLNAMEFMRIKEFLPTSAGNIIIPPKEIVAKSGSDFDIDKLTIMMPSIAMFGGKPEILKEYDSGLTPKATVARIEELKLLIIEARAEKKTTKKALNDKFQKLKNINLTEELIIEKAAILDPFINASKEASKNKEKFVQRITRFQGRDDLSLIQEEALNNAWKQLAYIENNQDQIDDELSAAKLEFNISKNLVNSRDLVKTAENKAYVAAMAKLENLKREQSGLSPEAIENSIIFSIKNILEMPSNFLPLITPNDTGLVYPMSQDKAHKREYKETEGAWGETESVSPTRYLEVGYNIHKHNVNSTGKMTLAMGAVDNTFNTIFNRIGAYMNPNYTTSKHTRRATIKMKHNTLNVGKEKGISLSHIYDVNNKNKISDIINQLLNGWLDVANDPFIFDLGGTQQLTPVMMLLLQAGVEFENAINFILNPIVKKYVKEQSIITNAFAKATGEASFNPNDFRNKAQKNMFAALGFLPEVSFQNKYNELLIDQKKLYAYTLDKTKGLDFSEPVDNSSNKGLTLNGVSLIEKISELDDYNAMNNKQAIAAFLHYLELEKLALQMTTLKSTLNYDTNKSNTLFDAQKTKVDLAKLKENDLFPTKIINNFFKETPVGAFNIADFQINLWSPLFNIRNNSRMNDLLLDDISDYNKKKMMIKMFGSEDIYIEEFKNGLITKLFIDEIKSFNVKDGYRGLNVKKADIKTYSSWKSKSLKDVIFVLEGGDETRRDVHLDKGVSVIDGVVYIDEYVLNHQWTNDLYTGYKKASPTSTAIRKKFIKDFNYGVLKLAPVDMAAFDPETGKADFINFSIEREYLRATNPFAEFSKSIYFEKIYKKNLAQRPKIQLDASTQPASEVSSPLEFTNHSGGAYGADTFWDIIGREFGVTNQKHYKDAGNSNLSKQLRDKGVKAEVLSKQQMDFARAEIFKLTGVKHPDNLQGNLQVRNYYQVANSDSVFAIARLNGDERLNAGSVFGGTNTAVQLGIKLGKPVYVFDVDSNQWFKNDVIPNTKIAVFKKMNTIPVLTKNFAGVGTRNIESYNVLNKETNKWEPRKEYLGKEVEASAKQAIRDVYEKTFSQPASDVMGKVDETLDQREKRLLQVTYEELLRDMALDNTLNFWKLFKNDEGNTMADQLFEIREMHPNLEKDFMIINDFMMSEGGRKNTKGWRDPSKGYKNITLRDNRVDEDTFNVYHENMIDLAGNAIIPINSMEDKLENTRLNEFFSRLPLVAFLQSGLDLKNSLSIMRAMPIEKIVQIIEAGAKKTVFTDQYLKAYRSVFNNHNNKKNISIRKRLQNYATSPKSENANRSLTKNSFTINHTIPVNWNEKAIEDIISGYISSTTRMETYNVKKGDIIEFTNSRTDRSTLVRATTNELPLRLVDQNAWIASENSTADGYAELTKEGVNYETFSFEPLDIDETVPSEQTVEINPANISQLESLVKNNPDVIFVLEGVESSNEMYVEGFGKVEKTDNMIGITTRIRPSTETKDLWSNSTSVENQKYLLESLEAVQELYDAGKKIAFIDSSKGYGSYMLDKNSQGKLIDSDSYKYLSAELLKRFNYSNRFSKIMTDTRNIIKENQNLTEFSIEIPYTEIIEAQERLTCKQ